jgi:hypothetical protein
MGGRRMKLKVTFFVANCDAKMNEKRIRENDTLGICKE